MTEKLRNLMHERATSAHFDQPDLDTLIRSGERVVRRRRAVTGAVGLAATAVVGATAFLIVGGSDDSTSTIYPATSTIQNSVPAHAVGSVIHNGQDTVDVGVPVRAFVRTAVGYVVADPSGAVRSVVDGTASKVGQVDASAIRIVSDPDSGLAGWVESGGDRPAFAVLDQADGSLTKNDEATTTGQALLADTKDPAYFYAVDGDTAYWRDSRGAVAVDVTSGETTVVKEGALNGFDIVDAESGRIVIGSDATTAEVTLADQFGSDGSFSPNGKYLSVDADAPEVYNTETGMKVDFTGVPKYFATGYEWLDNDTLIMNSLESEEAAFDVLMCSVSAASCEVVIKHVAPLDDVDSGQATLSIGESLVE